MSHSAESINILCRSRGLPVFQNIKALRDLLSVAREDGEFQQALTQHFANACNAVSRESDQWLYRLRRITDGLDEPAQAECDVLRRIAEQWHERQVHPVQTPGKPDRIPSAGADHENIHVYGSTAALCIELDSLRPDDGGRQLSTITVEAAKAMGGDARGRKLYDWKTKTIFQLTRKELPPFIGVVLGGAGEWVASGHGGNHDKRLIVRAQPSAVQVVVSQAGVQTLSVPIGAADLFSVIALSLKALGQNEPHLSSDVILTLCRRAVELPTGRA